MSQPPVWSRRSADLTLPVRECTAATAAATSEAAESEWLVTGAVFVGGGLIAAREVQYRRKKALGLIPTDEDSLLAPDHEHDDHVWMMTRDDDPLPESADGEDFDLLCDLLFNGPPRRSGPRGA